MDRLPRPCVCLLRRRARDRRAGQSQERVEAARPLRSRAEPDLRGSRAALRRGSGPGTTVPAPRQGEGRARRAAGRALDHRRAAQSTLRLDRWAERSRRAARRATQRATDAQAQALAARAFRRDRPSGAARAARGGVRVRGLGAAEGEHRLPRRIRPPLLQRAVRACGPEARSARDGDDDRGLPRRPPRREPSSQLRRAQGDDGPRAHGERTPGARRVDAVADRGVGGEDRSEDGGAGVGDHAAQAASRAGLPRVARRDPTALALPDDRIERACARALAHRAISYRSVEAILRHNLDRVADDGAQRPPPLPRHGNIRGANYYH